MGLPELYLAIDGYREANQSNANEPLTKNELKDMMERYPD